MALNPAQSIPKMFIQAYDIKAAYNFFAHPEATPDNLQLAHREVVLEQMHLPGRYLLLEDTSEMSWSGIHVTNAEASVTMSHRHISATGTWIRKHAR